MPGDATAVLLLIVLPIRLVMYIACVTSEPPFVCVVLYVVKAAYSDNTMQNNAFILNPERKIKWVLHVNK